MTAATRKDIKPLDLDQALAGYRAHVKGMTDAQLAVECARVEALPGGLVHDVVDDEFKRRHPEVDR